MLLNPAIALATDLHMSPFSSIREIGGMGKLGAGRWFERLGSESENGNVVGGWCVGCRLLILVWTGGHFTLENLEANAILHEKGFCKLPSRLPSVGPIGMQAMQGTDLD